MRGAASPPPPPLQDRSSAILGAGGVSPSFMVLKYMMDLNNLVDIPGPEWESIYCSSKKACGCGKHGQKLVEGLSLYKRRCDLPDLRSTLSIRLSDEALRSIQAELGDPDGRVQALGAINNVSQQLLVLLVSFRINKGSDRRYFLIFDSTDASLCMVPFIPSNVLACYTSRGIPLRAANDKDHELAVMARDPSSRRFGWTLICMCTPATRSNSESDGTGTWKVTKERPFPRLPPQFSVDVMFSFQGKVFWADLSQGVAYCDLHARDGALKFNFIPLPKAYLIHYDWTSDELRETPMMSRTMGCDGDSIKFICIDRSHPHLGNEMVKVWTLDLDHDQWKESMDVLWKELWMGELGEVVPQYPTLMPDGALCVLCKTPRPMETDFICSFDMHSKSLLSAGRVVNYCTIGHAAVPYNFFTMFNPSPPRKRKLPTHKKKLPKILKGTPKRSALAVQLGRN